jgi:hypothetical protein
MPSLDTFQHIPVACHIQTLLVIKVQGLIRADESTSRQPENLYFEKTENSLFSRFV